MPTKSNDDGGHTKQMTNIAQLHKKYNLNPRTGGFVMAAAARETGIFCGEKLTFGGARAVFEKDPSVFEDHLKFLSGRVDLSSPYPICIDEVPEYKEWCRERREKVENLKLLASPIM